MGRLKNQVALVTGGSKGIGEACVRRFVDEGAYILIADVDEGCGQSLAANLGDATRFHMTDVADEAQFSSAIEMAIQTWGKLDIVINNAGITIPAVPVQKTTNEEFNLLVDVNIRGVFFGCKLAYPHLRESKGCVVNISSMAGRSSKDSNTNKRSPTLNSEGSND